MNRQPAGFREWAAVLGVVLAGCTLRRAEPPAPAQPPTATSPAPTEAEDASSSSTPSGEPAAVLTDSPPPTAARTALQATTSAPAVAPAQPPVQQPTQPPPPTSLSCTYPWFASVPEAGCPDTAPVESLTAFQPFERGMMFWFEEPGRYVVLYASPTGGEGFSIIPDPLTVFRDTSNDIAAPEGLYAPVSGFGLVWRGDVLPEAGRGYRDLLGWALQPESGYDSLYQCRTGPTPHWSCYFSGPGGELVGLGSLGTWFSEGG